ncbi:rhodanese-like domain-containing protein [Planktosalinus lacus]|uniref:Rhodanese domain-containing protein n=1 Tax=Planktosalinus lacus TaxID=1526573 RepID=A0A8J2VB06_9FLAO|nr:rhodanese-like domain-containing protein [Planktosalinus lacus]GGD95282.1 hypothetical protein GCM10011312_18670 [Planktosalinus lacus]
MKTLLTITILIIQFQLVALECPKATLLNNTEFKQHISQNDVQLVDVRTKGEYEHSHIEGAYHADVLIKENFKTQFTEFNKDEPVYIYCRSGSRSKKAAQLLCELGFTKVYDLNGGYLNWE